MLDTGRAMRAFGATVERTGAGAWRVEGVGVGGFQEPEDVVDHGNSGTGVRLVMGAMATTDITATFTGDASLRGRPMGRITEPLSLFGAEARGRRGGMLPLTFSGAANPMPVQYTTPVPSAQVKSSVLLAGLNAPGETVVIERCRPATTPSGCCGASARASAPSRRPRAGSSPLRGQPDRRPQTHRSARRPLARRPSPRAATLLVPGQRHPARSRPELHAGGTLHNPPQIGVNIARHNQREDGGESAPTCESASARCAGSRFRPNGRRP